MPDTKPDDLPIGYTIPGWDHPKPDDNAEPDTYRYPDGCAVIKRANGKYIYIPNGNTHIAKPIFKSDRERVANGIADLFANADEL